MKFIDFNETKKYFRGKRVALFGSAPSCLDNNGDHIDAFDIIVRTNNYKMGIFKRSVGTRTDVHYSFYGTSIRKTREELMSDGVNLCMCKCPNANVHVTDWHKKHGKEKGGDFGWIYKMRKNFWFGMVHIPTKEQYMKYFNLLNQHVPTTGFAAILEIIECEPKELYITGFDFFRSGIHNVNEAWRKKNQDDPVKHVPEKEMEILHSFLKIHPIKVDKRLRRIFNGLV